MKHRLQKYAFLALFTGALAVMLLLPFAAHAQFVPPAASNSPVMVTTTTGALVSPATFFSANGLTPSTAAAPAEWFFTDLRLQDDTTPSHFLGVTVAENLTANVTLGIVTGGANRTLTLSGNATLVTGTMFTTAQYANATAWQNLGSISANQTITLGAAEQRYRAVAFTTAAPGFTIALATANATAGATIDLAGTITGSSVQPIVITNATTGGTQLGEFGGDQTGTYFGRFVYNGTAWNRVFELPFSSDVWTLLVTSTSLADVRGALGFDTDNILLTFDSTDYGDLGDPLTSWMQSVEVELANQGGVVYADAQALKNLTTGTGLVARTGEGTYALRTITGTNITVTNGDGVSGAPALSLPTTGVSAATYGNTTRWPSITVDSTGRVTGASNTSVGGTNTILFTTAAGNVSSIATANNGVLTTNGTGVPAIGSALPGGVTATTPAANVTNTTIATTEYVRDVLTSGQLYLVPHYTASTNWITGGNGTGTTGYAPYGAFLNLTAGAGNATNRWSFGNALLHPGGGREAPNFSKVIVVSFSFYYVTTNANVTARMLFQKKNDGTIGALADRGVAVEFTNTTFSASHYNASLVTGGNTTTLSANTGYAVQMVLPGNGTLQVYVNGTLLENFAAGVTTGAQTGQWCFQAELTNATQSEAADYKIENIRFWFGR